MGETLICTHQKNWGDGQLCIHLASNWWEFLKNRTKLDLPYRRITKLEIQRMSQTSV